MAIPVLAAGASKLALPAGAAAVVKGASKFKTLGIFALVGLGAAMLLKGKKKEDQGQKLDATA